MAITGNRGPAHNAKVLAAVLLMFPLATTACASTPSSADLESEICLRIGFSERIDSLNPLLGSTPASKVFCSLVYDCLQGVGENLEAVPNLALEWNVVEEFEPYGSVWDFNLTENAYWHDGMPLTANDVTYTINVMADYYVQMWVYQPYAFYINYAEKISDYSVRIHFYDRASGEPAPSAYTNSIHIPIFPKHILELWMFSIMSLFPADLNPIGSGPFMVTDNFTDELAVGEKITLAKNPAYHWKADKGLEVQLDKIELRFYDDGAALSEALENGTVDAAELSREAYLEMKERVDNGQLHNIMMFDGLSPNQESTYISLNAGFLGPNPSICDPKVRQALAHATDKEYIVGNHYLGLAEMANTLVPSLNDFWHCELSDEDLYEYDLDIAAQMLEDAGYRYVSSSTVREATGDSFAVQENLVYEGTKLIFSMAIRENHPEEKQIAMYLKERWEEIGVVMHYDVAAEPLVIFQQMCPYQLDMWIWSAQSDVDPQRILFTQSMNSWHSTWDWNQYYSPDYEENFSLSAQTLHMGQRREHVFNCQRIHYEDVGYIMLGELRQTYAWRTDNLTGWGDWAAHPGRSIDATWTGNILYFDLEPIDDDQTVVILAAAAMLLAAAAAVTVILVRHRRKA